MSDTINTAEIRVTADASGVEAGLQPAITAAQRAERAIAGIGAGAGASVERVVAAERSLVGSIQRTTAQMEAGSRTSARYYEVLAQQRGVDPAVLEPYLQQLRAVEQAQLRARGSTAGNTSSLNELGMSAGQTAAALQQVPAQITDIITSLQGGQSPLTVLIQQGGQLTDAFGSVEAALRAVGNQVMRMITPYTTAAAAVAVLGVAYYQGSEEADAFRDALARSGNTVGATVDELTDLAAAMAKVSGTQGAATEALVALVDAGNVPAERLQKFATVAIDLQKTLGNSVANTAQEFASLGERPVAASEQLNSKYRYLTAAVYDQIRALESQGLKEEAAALAQDTFASAMDKRAKKVVESLGYMETRWKELGKFASETWDKMLGVGRSDTANEKLSGLQGDLAGIEKNLAIAAARGDAYAERRLKASKASTQAQIAAMEATAAASKSTAKAEADAAQMAEARIKWRGEDAKYLSKSAQLERDITKARSEGGAAGVASAEIEKRIQGIRKSYLQGDWDAAAKKREDQIKREGAALAGVAGYTASYAEDRKLLDTLYAKGKISLEELNKEQAKLLAAQPGMRAAAEQELATRKELDEFNKRYMIGLAAISDVYGRQIDGATKEAEKNEELARTYGLSAAAIAQEEIARLKNQLARAAEEGLQSSETEHLKEIIALRERSAAALAGIEVKDANAKAAEQAADDWKRSAEQIGDALTDNIMRGGKSAAQYLKDLFRTLVLRPILQPIGNAAGNFVNGAMGMPGAAQAAGGGLAGITSAVSNLYSMVSGGATLAGGVGTGFLGSLAGGLNGAGVGSGLTSAMGLQMGNSIASVLGPTVSGAISSGLGALAAAAPWVAGAVALYSVAKKAFGMGPKEFTGTSTLSGWINGSGGLEANNYADWEKQGGWLRSDKGGSDKQAIGGELSAGILSTYDAIKTSTADYAKALGLNADMIAGRAQGLSITFGKDEAANQKAIADFFTGVADNVAREVLPSMDLFTRSGETAAQTLQRMAVNAAGVEQVLASIGIDSKAAFGAVSNVSLLARERLVDFAGGLEAFAANTAGFQQNFLTEAERNAPVLKAVTEQLAALGLAGVDTRDEFKSVVLGLDLTSEAGAKQYGELMKMQAAFAQLYPVIEATAAAADTAAEALAQVNKGYQDEIDNFRKAGMSAVELRAFETQGMEASTVALYDRLAGLKAADAIDQKAKADAASLESTNQGFQQQIDNLLKAGMSAGAVRAMEIAGMDASTVALYDRVAALTKEASATQERKGLQNELNSLTLTSAELLNIQRNALDESNKAIFDSIQGAKKQKEVEGERKTLQEQYDNLTMSSTQLRERERAALEDSNKALYDSIQAIKDQAAAVQAAKDIGANLLSGVDTAFSALQSVVGREKALLQEVTSKHQALASALRGTLDGMNPGGQEREDRLGAQAQIRAALAIAKASGVLPDVDAIRGALSVVGKDSSALFSTQQDYLRDFYSTQADIASLAGLTDKTLSVEEQSLKAMDDILKNAQQQVDALKGIDLSVLTLVEVMRDFDGALGAAKADPVASSGGSIAGLYRELLGRPADSAGLEFWKGKVTEGVTLAQIREAFMGSDERQDYVKGLRGFAVGTNYVTTDMPALIHEGERIMPAADNRELMRRLAKPASNDQALAKEVARLGTKFDELFTAVYQVAKNTGRGASVLERLDRAGFKTRKESTV